MEYPTTNIPTKIPEEKIQPSSPQIEYMEYSSSITPKQYSNNSNNFKKGITPYKATPNKIHNLKQINIPIKTSDNFRYKISTGIKNSMPISYSSYSSKSFTKKYPNGSYRAQSPQLQSKIIPMQKIEHSPVKKNNHIKIIKIKPQMKNSIILSQKLVEPMPMKKSYYFPKMRNVSYEKRISKSPKTRTNLKFEKIDDVIRYGYKPRVYFRKIRKI